MTERANANMTRQRLVFGQAGRYLGRSGLIRAYCSQCGDAMRVANGHELATCDQCFDRRLRVAVPEVSRRSAEELADIRRAVVAGTYRGCSDIRLADLVAPHVLA